MSALNIWNDTALRGWIAGFAADGDDRTADLLCLALEKPLRAHRPALKWLESLPSDAPGWLKQKFGTAAFHTFDPSLDPGLDEKIRHIRDWIAGAVASEEAWTKEEKPKRLLHFKTVDDAMKAADKAMKEEALRLREVFKNNPAAFDDENAKTVMTLEDGFRIVRLLTPEALDRESAAMGHCIGNGGYDKKLRDDRYAYYSLRDSLNNPHATLEVKDRALLQCKGKQNVQPEEKYFPSLRAFIEREEFLLVEDAGHTGLWQDLDGTYHSVRRLPKGVRIKGDLDLSSLHDVILPENLFVQWQLILNGADPPGLPEGLRASRIGYQYKNGKLHHESGPAEIWRDLETDVVTREEWRQNGRRHREDGPALIERGQVTGVVICKMWYKNGQLHREDGPAVIEYDAVTGIATSKTWYKNGEYHREDGPAVLRYDPITGVLTRESWWQNGWRHREDGPALIIRSSKAGIVLEEEWWKNGQQINPPSPAAAKGASPRVRP